jgi:hypothetical protein
MQIIYSTKLLNGISTNLVKSENIELKNSKNRDTEFIEGNWNLTEWIIFTVRDFPIPEEMVWKIDFCLFI